LGLAPTLLLIIIRDVDMKTKLSIFKVVLFVCVFSLLFTALFIPVTEAKYPNPSKTITFIVPVNVGGGYDLYTRMMVPFLSKELNARIVVRNIPGGAWMIGLTKIYKAKPDGYTIGIWNPGLMAQDRDVLGKVDYDMTTFTYLYRITNEPRVVIVKAKGPIKDFKDLLEKGRSPDFKLRSSYAGGTALLDAKLMESEWGIKSEKIPYSGGSQTRLAVMRGDTQFCVSGLGSSIDALPTGQVKFVLLLHDKPMKQMPEASKWVKEFPQLKDLPIPTELGLKELSYVSKSARCIIAPPGLPKKIKEILENAIEKVLHNKDLRKLGEKRDRPFGEGQSGAAYAEQMRKDKMTLIKIKHLLK